jgi:hypothetical protein
MWMVKRDLRVHCIHKKHKRETSYPVRMREEITKSLMWGCVSLGRRRVTDALATPSRQGGGGCRCVKGVKKES